MKDIVELLRMPSPAPRPQALAYDGQLLWMGSLGTSRLYAIEPSHWTVREEAQAPGLPYGATVVGDELRVLLGEGPEDHRTIRRFVPGHGFRTEDAIACPDDTGSQLSYDGDRLYVSQWYNKRILSLGEHGEVGSVIESPRGICGQVVVDGCFYVLNTNDEDTTEYYVTRIDARNGAPKVEDVARVPFGARALAFDGERFWTNHREHHEMVAFKID
ncbi:MAG TPA: hypothetical protein VIG51_01375 [Candidatus Baltobacteraceae bacterium]|jgi:hypothetical protein